MMNDLDNAELASVIGGTECDGIWLGTRNMEYGICLGRRVD